MEKIMVNVWGAQTPAILTTWSEIKKLGFLVRDRSFGTLNDGTQALFFNGAHTRGRANDGRDEWYLTTETLEQISDW